MEKENNVTIKIDVKSNIDELLRKAERFNALMKEANALMNELASVDLELEIKG